VQFGIKFSLSRIVVLNLLKRSSSRTWLAANISLRAWLCFMKMACTHLTNNQPNRPNSSWVMQFIMFEKTLFHFWPLAPYIDPHSLEGFVHVSFLFHVFCISTCDEMELSIYSTTLHKNSFSQKPIYVHVRGTLWIDVLEEAESGCCYMFSLTNKFLFVTFLNVNKHVSIWMLSGGSIESRVGMRELCNKELS
jgi:hypothetical protein